MKKIIGVILIIAVLLPLMPGILPIVSADEPSNPGTKIESLLALQVDSKLHQFEAADAMATIEEGAVLPFAISQAVSGDLQNQKLFLYFEQQPTSSQIVELEALGVTVYPESWVPPLENHPAGYVFANMPVDKLNNVASIDSVVSLSSAEVICKPHNDQAAIATHTDWIWNGSGSAVNTGSGVTVAIIDSGFEVDHPDFPALTAGVNYKDYSPYPNPPDNTVANCCTGHGTHVAGTVLGRGTSGSPSGIYKGAAYEATPLLLKIGGDSSSDAGSGTMSAAITAAVDTYDADIITMSYGGWSTYHDGSDAMCQAVDYAVSQGVPVFISAGNDAYLDYHYSGTVDPGSYSAWIQVDAGGVVALYYNMVWYDGLGTNNDLELEYHYDTTGSSPFNSGSITSFAQSESSRGTESEISYYGWGGSLYGVSAGTYYLRVKNNSGNSQSFHLYYRWNSDATFANPDPDYTIGSPAEADGAIAIGSYVTRKQWWRYDNTGAYYYINPEETEGQISSFSSRGPRIDGVAKPSVVAPGDGIISMRDDDVYTWGSADAYYIDNDGPNQDWSLNNATNEGMAKYYMMHGTSMACPHAAGIAALLLQANPDWTPDQVRHALESKAVDKGTGGHDNIYGWGLIHAQEAIGEADSVPTIVSCTSSGVETNSFASGETVYVKGSGLEASASYNLWIQSGTIVESTTLVVASDPSSSIESVVTSSTGSFTPQAIWSPSLDAGSYDIVVDQQGSGSGTYNAIDDGVDGIDAVGFVVPIPELAVIILVSLGLITLGGFVWLRRRKREPVPAC